MFAGGCDIERTYDGPKLPQRENGEYYMSREFIHAMIEYFKSGKTLPKRCVRGLVWFPSSLTSIYADTYGKSSLARIMFS